MSREDDVHIAIALCFDGYAYLDAHPCDYDAILGQFYHTGQWQHASPREQLTVFFVLQRFLYKWSGEMLPRNSREWRAFRSLFLQTCCYVIPAQYQHPDYYEDWQKRFAPDLAYHIALVRDVHEDTEYEGV